VKKSWKNWNAGLELFRRNPQISGFENKKENHNKTEILKFINDTKKRKLNCCNLTPLNNQPYLEHHQKRNILRFKSPKKRIWRRQQAKFVSF
jgi:hypothetical protein